jgi:4-amino-4-deoxy-L-arabinose transferase-like glycosyltransferase
MRPVAPLLAATILVAAALLLIGSAREHSLTVDEAHYIGLGRGLVERGDWNMPGALLHPPLPFYVNSLLLFGIPVADSVWAGPDGNERGRDLCRGASDDRFLFRSRIPTVLLALVLLLLVFLEAKRLFGTRAGLFALLLAAFEPNLLAHGSVGTPDMILTLFFFLAVLRFRRFREEGGAGNLVVAGAALGLALLSKYSALVLLAIVPVAAFADRAGPRFAARYALAALIALAVVYAAYSPLVLHDRNAALFGDWLLPAPYAGGIEQQRQANEGHRAYFMGEVSFRGWFAYYPVAFLVKTPLPFLVLAAVGVFLLVRGKRRSDLVWLLLPPLLFFLFFVFVSRINIGIRYVLPVYPFLALAGGFGAASVARKGPRIAVLLLLVWHVGGALAAYPHFLPYFNEAVGGPEGGSRILLDSNLDWGQDLPSLKRFLDENGYAGVYLGYFGGDDPARYGIRCRYLPGWTYTPPPDAYRRSLDFHPDPELVAISRMLLQGVWTPEPEVYAWLNEYPRVATIGHSILVFDIGGDPAAHEKLAAAYWKAGLLDLFRYEMEVAAHGREKRTPGPR